MANNIKYQKNKTIGVSTKFSQRGFSLYLAVMIMILSLAMIFGLSTIFFGQIKMIRGIGYSVVAFYAADAGMERLLYQDEECRRHEETEDCDTLDWSCELDCSGLEVPYPAVEGSLTGVPATYKIRVTVQESQIVFQSVGQFRNIRRAIAVAR